MTSFNEREGADPIQATQQRLLNDASSAEWRRMAPGFVEQTQLDGRLPLFINLGRRVLSSVVEPEMLAIINPAIHLSTTERIGLNPDVSTLLIQPSSFNPLTERGYKALRPGDTFVLGRRYNTAPYLKRFSDFGTPVSRHHLEIGLGEDGLISLQDLGSTNGSYIGEKPYTPLSPFAETPSISQEFQTTLEISSHAHSIASERHPLRNEDAFFRDDETQVYGVFDGVSEGGGGDRASAIAASILEAESASLPSSASPREMGVYMKAILQKANAAILEQRHTPSMGSTAVILKVHTSRDGKSRIATIASSGDSRAYIFRDGRLGAITTDHDAYRASHDKEDSKIHQEKLAATESIKALVDERDQMDFNFRNLISSKLGMQNVPMDIEYAVIEPGDILVLSTDGVHDNLSTEEIRRILLGARKGKAAEDLVSFAKRRSLDAHDRAKPDDMTALVVEL